MHPIMHSSPASFLGQNVLLSNLFSHTVNVLLLYSKVKYHTPTELVKL